MEAHRPAKSNEYTTRADWPYRWIHHASTALSAVWIVLTFSSMFWAGVATTVYAMLFYLYIGPLSWDWGDKFRRFILPTIFTSRGPGDAFSKKVYWLIGPQFTAYSTCYFPVWVLPGVLA